MAARKKEPVDVDNPEAVGGKKKRSRIVVILMILAGTIVGIGMIMGIVLYFIGIPGVMPKLKADPPPVYETLEMTERVINLADVGGGRYLRVKMAVEYKKNEELTAELKEKNAEIMDGLLSVIRSKSVEDVQPVEQLEKIKAEVKKEINSKLKNGKIEKIYFTDFLIQ